MDRTRIKRSTIKLEFKGNTPMGRPRKRWLSRMLEEGRKELARYRK
jgi:hypothetical protein